MANLTVRRIDDEIYERLRLRAARHGVSMEKEVRRILANAVATPERLGQLALECFGETGGVELDLDRSAPHEPLNLSE